ncbi:MAG: M23 family metallopeptidase [Dehalogenimonas sp.]
MIEKDDVTMTEILITSIKLMVVPCNFVYSYRIDWWDILGNRQNYDLVVNAIVLHNLSNQRVSLESITFEGAIKGQIIQNTILDQAAIQKIMNRVLVKDQLGLRRLIDLILGTKLTNLRTALLSANTEIESGHVLVLPNIYLMFHTQPDRLMIGAKLNTKGNELNIKTELGVVERTCPVKYSMPLHGIWLMKGIPNSGVLDHHRFGISSSFGVDFLRLGPQGEVFKNDGKLIEDYFSYSEKVFAAAEGKVISVHDAEVQCWSRFNPDNGETEDHFQKRQFEEIQTALHGDIGKWVAGNYIIIQHKMCEYSAYLHLKQHSAIVKEGDIIQRGQQIAEVGNTGDSFGAHLHFQVIDSPDLVEGRSLPFEFENLEFFLSEPGCLVKPIGQGQ